MDYWAKAPQPRDQLVLFSTTVDDVIPLDHPVRLLGDLLDRFDWSTWEGKYHGSRGKPPIRPRVLAGLWLYGLRRGVRSSRKLEYMAGHNVDFIWLAEGHVPDHSTLSDFRKESGKALKELFVHVLRIAMKAGLLDLVDVATDGTRVRANSNRYETWTTESVAKVIDERTAKFEQELAKVQETDRREDDLFGNTSMEKLPPELADIKTRRDVLLQIQQDLQAADEARRKEGINPARNPAQIPKHDPDSRVLPNKEGGYAPNYTPLCTTDGKNGFIVDVDVIPGNTEQAELLASMDRLEETLGQKPENCLGDGAYGTGPNINGLEQRGIAFYTNLPSPDPATNPAIRPDPTQPVPEDQRDKLPVSPQTKKLDKTCFVYDSVANVFYCPQGQPMPYDHIKNDTSRGQKVQIAVYRCHACSDCPLKSLCLSKDNKKGRTVGRDAYATQRENLAAKMREEPARKKYDQRMRIAETPFSLIKHVMGLRQFLLRGLEKVKLEWMWACAAINVDKLAQRLFKPPAKIVDA